MVLVYVMMLVQVLLKLVLVDVQHGIVQVLAAMVNAVKEVVRPTVMREVRGEVGRRSIKSLDGA